MHKKMREPTEGLLLKAFETSRRAKGALLLDCGQLLSSFGTVATEFLY